MGYRNKIALLSKERHAIIKDMTYGELVKWYQKNLAEDEVIDEDDDYVPCYELSEEIYELGKYCELQYMKPHIKPIFSKVRTNNKFNDEGEFYIIGKEGMITLIEQYRVRIAKYFESLVDPSKSESLFPETPESHLRAKLNEWNNKYCRPYSLNLDEPVVVESWSYEYAIFELVRILKTVDHDKYEICITGW